jgi:hypothetical protein
MGNTVSSDSCRATLSPGTEVKREDVSAACPRAQVSGQHSSHQGSIHNGRAVAEALTSPLGAAAAGIVDNPILSVRIPGSQPTHLGAIGSIDADITVYLDREGRAVAMFTITGAAWPFVSSA